MIPGESMTGGSVALAVTGLPPVGLPYQEYREGSWGPGGPNVAFKYGLYTSLELVTPKAPTWTCKDGFTLPEVEGVEYSESGFDVHPGVIVAGVAALGLGIILRRRAARG